MQSSYDETLENVSYAGFWARFFAYLIDSVIVWFGLLIVRLFMAGVSAALSGTILGGNLLFHYDLTDIVLYLAKAAYFILFTYYTGSTLGKKALNLRVVCAEEEKDLKLWNVIYRETIGRFLCTVTVGIGYLLAVPDKEKRGLHDMLCDTRVIYAKKVRIYPTYYSRSGKHIPKEALYSGDVLYPGNDSYSGDAFRSEETAAFGHPTKEEDVIAKGERVMQKGDFAGYRMVRPEDKAVGKIVEAVDKAEETAPDPETKTEEGEKNEQTERNGTVEDK